MQFCLPVFIGVYQVRTRRLWKTQRTLKVSLNIVLSKLDAYEEYFMKSHRYFVLTPVLILLLALTGSLIARAQDVVTVTWWTESGDFLQHVQDTYVKAFNDSHPNIKLELVGQEKLDDVLRTAFQAGEAPDI